MLAQCPQCRTVFRATPAQLAAAGGRVRCGRCSAVFDLTALPAFEPDASRKHDALRELAAPDLVELDLEDSDPLADTADHELIDLEVESSPTVEITLEGERINIDGEALEEQIVDLDSSEAARPDDTLRAEPLSFDRPAIVTPGNEARADEEPAWEALGDDLRRTARPTEEASDADIRAPAARDGSVLPLGWRVAFRGEARTEEALPAVLAPKTRRRFSPLWIGGSVLLLIALLAQIVHLNRAKLAGHPLFGPPLARAYAWLGAPWPAAWDLRAYEVRQGGALAEPQGGGTLRVRASLLNSAAFAQPWPLLRLTLQDRFGGRLSAYDLGPENYLPEPPSEPLLAPGRRIEAEIAVLDPGTSAVGFELDVCLRVRDDVVECANDPTR